VARYRARISGPLLDRIDMHVQVPALEPREMNSAETGEASASIKERVQRARDRQMTRQGSPNARLSGAEANARAVLDAQARGFLREAGARMHLTARAHHRVLKVARTIADLAASEPVLALHLAEAISYRDHAAAESRV
jgi:magnesium chelatase family protein